MRRLLTRSREPYIVFDVGSCDGKQFLERCRRDRDTVVYAFEPEPESFAAVCRNTEGVDNFHAFRMAVTDEDGSRQFKVSSVIGNHSFHEFVADVNATWKSPYVDRIPWLPDFRKEEDITVETTRLDTFMAKMRISHVSFLHIDAQGEDLNVLKSLGEKARVVRAGVIEVCLKPLYVNHFTKAEALATLDRLGFRVTRIEPDYFGLVENVYFVRG
jgi:FkbM family methyltransferase